MNQRENTDFEELEDLLWRAEEVLKPLPEDNDELLENFLREDTPVDAVPYQNYANHYQQPDTTAHRSVPAADTYREAPRYGDVPTEPAPSRKKEKKRRARRRRGCGCGCLTWLLVLVGAVALSVTLLFRPPQAQESIGDRKADTATILICGTDKDGTRTDTMMLLYLSGSERQAGLLSLPRDSYTLTSSGNAAKLNSAYGRNGTGQEGMEALLDYVRDIIGYRPDGYILVDFTLVPQIVDIMGGVEVEVPMDMSVSGVSLEEGLQHLNGKEVLTLLRYRKGYAMADLARVEVQRDVIQACIQQWLSPEHLQDAGDAIALLENGSLSSLNTGNYLWVAKTLLLSMGNFTNDTLPGTAEYRGGASYYILDKTEIAELINSSYNPYKVTIDTSDLKIAG